MDNSDNLVDLAHDDVRTAPSSPADLPGRVERHATIETDAPGTARPQASIAGRSLLGNPRRIRL